MQKHKPITASEAKRLEDIKWVKARYELARAYQAMTNPMLKALDLKVKS